MGVLHGFSNVIGELVRTTATAGRLVEVELRPLPDSGSRARRSAQFSVSVRLPWLTPHDLQFVTQRGYVAGYTFKAVSLWLVKNLPGVACSLSVKMPDATTLPAKWTEGRVNAQVARIAEINPSAIRAAAADKAESVREWAESTRKHETLASARAMSEAAAMLDVMRVGAAWPEPDPVLQVGPPPPPPPPPPASGPEWTPTPGAAGARVVPLHMLTGEAPAEVETSVEPEQATHILAAALKDDQGASFWGVDMRGRFQTLMYCSDAQALAWVRTVPANQPSLFTHVESTAYPFLEDGDARPVSYALIRLSDGAILQRTDRTGTTYTEVPASGAAQFQALNPDGAIMGFATTAAGAKAAARAYLGWLLPQGTDPYPAPGDVLQWLECNLSTDTETPRLLTYTGRAVVGLAGDPVQVRPTATVNAYGGNPVKLATHALMVPGEVNGAPVYYVDDWTAVDAASDASAIDWAQNTADMWGRPYDALRRVLVRLSDGAALGERVNVDGNWVWGATTAGNAGRMVWAPGEALPNLLGTTRAGNHTGAADLARSWFQLPEGDTADYFTTPMGSDTPTDATVTGTAAVPTITPV